MLAKNSLALARQGYDLMDKKRNIRIRELMSRIDEARDIQDEIDSTFTYAYQCLQRANIEHGINMVSQLAYTVPIENSISIRTRSIMGTEIPHVKYAPVHDLPTYAFSTTRESIDQATKAFQKVKDLTVKLSMVENAAYRLASNIKKTQKHQEDEDEEGLNIGKIKKSSATKKYPRQTAFLFSGYLLPYFLLHLFFCRAILSTHQNHGQYFFK